MTTELTAEQECRALCQMMGARIGPWSIYPITVSLPVPMVGDDDDAGPRFSRNYRSSVFFYYSWQRALACVRNYRNTDGAAQTF